MIQESPSKQSILLKLPVFTFQERGRGFKLAPGFEVELLILKLL